MTVNDVFALLEEVGAVKLSDDFCAKYRAYDNSGIIINCGGEVAGALFALDLNSAAVSEAERLGFNLIVTHHPAIYGGVTRFDLTQDPQAKALAECMKKGISVISMHLNFDIAPEGIDYCLMRGLGGRKAKCAAAVEGGAYGRVFEIAPVICRDYLKKIAQEFNSGRAVFYGDESRKITRVASFCGAGCDEHNIAFAKSRGAELFVSADMKHHEICALTQSGISVLVMTHYASENYGFNKIYLNIKDRLKARSAYFTDERYL